MLLIMSIYCDFYNGGESCEHQGKYIWELLIDAVIMSVIFQTAVLILLSYRETILRTLIWHCNY